MTKPSTLSAQGVHLPMSTLRLCRFVPTHTSCVSVKLLRSLHCKLAQVMPFKIELSKKCLQAQASAKGFAAQQQSRALPNGLATLGSSGQGLATLTQTRAFSQGIATMPSAIATSGTTPGALHLGELTVSVSLVLLRLFVCKSCLHGGRC